MHLIHQTLATAFVSHTHRDPIRSINSLAPSRNILFGYSQGIDLRPTFQTITCLSSSSSMVEYQFRTPEISCFWIGIYGLIQIALWIKIMTIRATKSPETHKVGNLATWTDSENLRATRAHGNYTENAPIFAIMLLAADMMGVISPRVLDTTGFVFATGRFFHALGLYAAEGTSVGRIAGALTTMLSLIAAAAQCLISAFVLSGESCLVRFIGLAISLAISMGFAGLIPGGKTKD